MNKKILATVLCIITVFSTVLANAENKETDIQSAIKSAITWKDKNDSPLSDIGSASSDFYIMALRRLGKSYDYEKYLLGLEDVSSKYTGDSNAEDMQRTTLTVAASGGDAESFGGRDLVADSVFFRNGLSEIDKNGVSGYSLGLITVDTMAFEPPQWATLNRDDIIVGILSAQNENGSFEDDIYTTAMAITALAPYYETSGAYTITQTQTGYVLDLSPKTAIDKGIEYLSSKQDKDGDFGDLKSTATTVIALDAVGIDADNDDRFVAKNGSLLEALMQYQQGDGGFSTGKGRSNGEATSYAIVALTSHLRKIQGKSAFFDFSDTDTAILETPAPTKVATATATAKPKSTATPKATAKATASPTTSPKASTKITGTMKPTKTATPLMPNPTSSASPKPAKPALVGPVEMPGPMPLFENDVFINNDKANNEHTLAKTIVVSVLFLILVVSAILLIFIAKRKNMTLDELLNEMLNLILRKKKKGEIYKAKTHRKTEEHRRYENRERYKQRLKYKNR